MKLAHLKTFAAGVLIGSIGLSTVHAAFVQDGSVDISNDLKTQVELLKDATDYLGVDAPDKAVAIWANGVETRSAAKQYCVMTKELKEAYESALAEEYSNWVTGWSSPWVEAYEVVQVETVNETTCVYKLQFDTMTSAGADEPFHVTLTLVKDGDFWRIAEIVGDQQSQSYTGYVNEIR